MAFHPMKTTEHLTALLAERAMGWRVGPDRFLLGGRQWKPRHYFQPTKRPADAFRLLDASGAERYTITRCERGNCSAQVQIKGVVGEAREASEALAISLAIARAIGIDAEATK
jgi:hypothetical protein